MEVYTHLAGTVTVEVKKLGEYSGTVELSHSSPDGIDVSFSPQSGTPPFTSTMTITVGSSVGSGTYSIHVTGSDGSATYRCTFTLDVSTVVQDYKIYSDSGIPSGATVLIWPPDVIPDSNHGEANDGSGAPGDPQKYQWISWDSGWFGGGIKLSGGEDHSQYEGGSLRFYVKGDRPLTGQEALKVQISSESEDSDPLYIDHYGWDKRNTEWQEVIIPLSEFKSGGNPISLSSILEPFKITTEMIGSTYKLSWDYVRWSADPGFTMRIDPADAYLDPGESVEVTVRVMPLGGYSGTVSLSYEGAPSGTTVTFEPESGDPPFTSTMTIQVGDSAESGTYSIKVKGWDGESEYTCTFTLDVSTVIPDYILYNDGGVPTNDLEPAPGGGYLWKYTGNGSDLQVTEISGGCTPDPNRSWKYGYTNNPGGWAGYFMKFKNEKDISNYTYMKFYVKGQNGGERFEVFIEDTSHTPTKQIITATSNWTEIVIPLTAFNEDLTKIVIPFNIAFSSGVTGGNATVYIDYIRYTV